MEKDFEKQVTAIKESLDKAKNLRIRAETRLEQLNKQKQEILKEITDLGVEPDKIESEIEKLKSEIEDLLNKANEMLPSDIIK